MKRLKTISFLVLLIITHYIVFSSFVLTALLGIVYLPWFIAIATTSLIIRVIFDKVECPLTVLENRLRVKLNLDISKGFLKDYILNPKKTFKYLINSLK